MKIEDRLSAAYDVSGVMVHRFITNDFGGRRFGTLTTHMSSCRVTGYELVESIRIAREHIEEVEQAIRNMLCILDTAEPIKQEPKA